MMLCFTWSIGRVMPNQRFGPSFINETGHVNALKNENSIII